MDFGTGSYPDGEHGLPVERRRDETVEKDLPFSLPAPSCSLIRISSREGLEGKEESAQQEEYQGDIIYCLQEAML